MSRLLDLRLLCLSLRARDLAWEAVKRAVEGWQHELLVQDAVSTRRGQFLLPGSLGEGHAHLRPSVLQHVCRARKL